MRIRAVEAAATGIWTVNVPAVEVLSAPKSKTAIAAFDALLS
jgi:hypothetical protein